MENISSGHTVACCIIFARTLWKTDPINSILVTWPNFYVHGHKNIIFQLP
jgi:hypothetical protein